ncbi:phage Gp19/Gp15/Gp42 family protein [Bifidobacterium pseudolongum]|uniref:Gp19/Gp15/Gp42 family protein n=1 Tax=Bifidobacterium pseudolongum TaxID=1694 RepID=UPI001F0EFE9E|nr:Gp19/Gp15/Gp42 family protein [Bifidobacterium pseudolongum]MCH4835307.1 phage Gp19/Gp15/Gp42 family protein [Bifidobacterium pseudolongum]
MTNLQPFATVDDLEARWHDLTDGERARAAVLLEDASDLIRTQCAAWESRDVATLRRVTCSVVKRAMLASDLGVPEGVSQTNTTTGPFSDGYTFANPGGDLYLLDAERRSLGMGRAKAFHVRMAPDDEGAPHDPHRL